MEPKQEFVLALVSIALGGSVVLTLISSVAKVLTSRRGKGDDRMLAQVDDRLARMEQAIETMAIEMERLGEGQRFTTKLLSERPMAGVTARDGAGERASA